MGAQEAFEGWLGDILLPAAPWIDRPGIRFDADTVFLGHVLHENDLFRVEVGEYRDSNPEAAPWHGYVIRSKRTGQIEGMTMAEHGAIEGMLELTRVTRAALLALAVGEVNSQADIPDTFN